MMNLKYGMKRLGVRDDQQLVSIERTGGGGRMKERAHSDSLTAFDAKILQDKDDKY